jgi:hypothetical protein
MDTVTTTGMPAAGAGAAATRGRSDRTMSVLFALVHAVLPACALAWAVGVSAATGGAASLRAPMGALVAGAVTLTLSALAIAALFSVLLVTLAPRHRS